VRSKIGGAKFCSPPKAITASMKNAKHIHTTGRPRNANDPPAFFGGSAALNCASSRSLRLKNTNASAASPTAEAPAAAARHPEACAMARTNAGAAAQPRLPESPCTENAWPRRCVETRRLRSV